MMASLPFGVIATACGGPAIVCSTPSTTAVILGGNWEASITARLWEGAGCGEADTPSTRAYLPSFADTIRSAALDSWGHRAPATRRAAEACDRKSFMGVSWLQSAGLRGIWANSTGPLLTAQAATATSGRRRRIAACTTKVIRPPAARQAARNSIGAIVLPVTSRIHGTTFWAMKPPRLPTELMAASPAAADAPVRNLEGRLHSTGWGAKMPAAAMHKKANFTALPGT